MQIIIDLPIDAYYHVKKKNTSKIDIDIILEAIYKSEVYIKEHSQEATYNAE